MTRSELVQRLVSHDLGLTAQQAEKAIDVILTEITASLSHGNRVELRGFGVFSTRYRQSRTGRNPKTGAVVKVDAKAVPFFKAGKKLRQKLNPNL